MNDAEIEKHKKLSEQCEHLASAMVSDLDRANLASVVAVCIRGEGVTAGGVSTKGDGSDDLYLVCSLAAATDARISQLARDRNLSEAKLRMFVCDYIQNQRDSGYVRTISEGLQAVESLR